MLLVGDLNSHLVYLYDYEASKRGNLGVTKKTRLFLILIILKSRLWSLHIKLELWEFLNLDFG
jgi:hypothetical protein